MKNYILKKYMHRSITGCYFCHTAKYYRNVKTYLTRISPILYTCTSQKAHIT